MAELTLNRKEADTLKINIGEDSFSLPLQGSLTFKEAKQIGTPAGTYDYLKKHIPSKIIDNLTVNEYREIVKVWNDESAKASGITLGES